MLKRSFHATAKALLAGRRSGAAAFEQGPRELSKKQKKRRATRLVEKSERIDQKKAKVKSRHLSSQLDSMDINEMVGETAAKLGDTLKELMLPDGAPSQEEGQQLLLLQPKKEFENPMGLLKRLVAKRDRLERNNALAAPPVSAVGTALVPAIVDTDVDDDVTYLQVVDGVKRLAERGKVAEALKVLALVPSCGVAADCKVYTVAMAALSHKTVRNYSAAERIFDLMVKDGVTPNEIAWGALIHAQAKGKGPDAALTQIDRLKGLGVQPTVHMFTSVLNALIDAKRYDDAQELWLRMHGEGIELTKEAFTTMLKHCAKTGQVERAFFYLDEMQACRAEPDVHTYLLLFRACAEAPHWVNGYHDIIFDAMTKMEGSELMPTAEIYNAIIYAFSRAGDPVAAEFYFDEMRRKGLRPGVYTYNTLLNAYKRSQSVGALHYGSKGRYTALPERAPTEEEQAYMDVGATRVSSLISKGLWKDGAQERGKRQYGRMEDLLDDDEEARDAFSREIMSEARARRPRPEGVGELEDGFYDDHFLVGRNERMLPGGPRARAGDAEDDGDVDFEALAAADPALRKLITEIDEDTRTRQEQRRHHKLGKAGRAAAAAQAAQAAAAQIRQADGPDGRVSDTSAGSAAEPVDGALFSNADASFLSEASRDKGAALRRGGVTRELLTADDYEALVRGLESEPDSDGDEVDVARNRGQGDGRGRLRPAVARAMQAAAGKLPARQPPAQTVAEVRRRNELVNLMDNGESSVDEYTERATRAPSSVTSTSASASASASAPATTAAGDHPAVTSGGEVTMDEIAGMWDMVEFGRAPNPDYSISLSERREGNIARAEELMRQMRQEKLTPDVVTLTTMMGVYGEAHRADEALAVLKRFDKHNLVPNASTYRTLVRMHILKKDIAAAIACKEQMVGRGLQPDAETYGLLVQSLTHRDMVVEGLQMLEEATGAGVSLADRHVRFLRSRCDTLGIKHPNIPADPRAWAKDVKKMRTATKHTNKRKVEAVKSAMYG